MCLRDLYRPRSRAKYAVRARAFHLFLTCPQMFHVATPLGYPEYENQGPTDMSLLNHSQKRSTNPPSMASVAYQEYILRAEGRVVLQEYTLWAKSRAVLQEYILRAKSRVVLQVKSCM